MRAYALSPRAQADLEQIWDYTAHHWGAAQAETYIRGIQAAIIAIAENPLLGRACDDVRPDYRKHATGAHLLFYRETQTRIEIMRILHQRMDVDQHV